MVQTSRPTEGTLPQMTTAGLERVAEAMGAAAAVEKLLTRTERQASEGKGWFRVPGSKFQVCFCRGLGGAHEPHFVYMLGVQHMTRTQALALMLDEWVEER